MRESWHQLEDVVLKILFSRVTVTSSIVERYLDPCLEQIYLSDNIMEERHNFDSTILVALEFEESRCCEKLLAFSWQSCRNIDELIIVDSLCAIVWLRDILLE